MRVAIVGTELVAVGDGEMLGVTTIESDGDGVAEGTVEDVTGFWLVELL
ncbi:MAG: hypothetical protein WDN07_05570 [Actinomycetota bacterium]